MMNQLFINEIKHRLQTNVQLSTESFQTYKMTMLFSQDTT